VSSFVSFADLCLPFDLCPFVCLCLSISLLSLLENKGWELVDEARQHATEWYEIKMEDLYHEGKDTHFGDPGPAVPMKK
jgi:hypothetical protein